MNKERRKSISALIEELEALKERIDQIKEEEQEYYDAMPEGFQQGEKGSKAEEVIDLLESAYSDMETVIENLQQATE